MAAKMIEYKVKALQNVEGGMPRSSTPPLNVASFSFANVFVQAEKPLIRGHP